MDPSDRRAARVAALDSLARRDRAAHDMRTKLRDKGFDPAVADEVVDELIAERLIDDRRYAESFILYHAGRGQGPLRVRMDLRRAGVAAELIEAGIQGYGEWLAQAGRARQKKFGAALPNDYADRQRQAKFLAYRGFTGPLIRITLGVDLDLDLDLDADTTL